MPDTTYDITPPLQDKPARVLLLRHIMLPYTVLKTVGFTFPY